MKLLRYGKILKKKLVIIINDDLAELSIQKKIELNAIKIFQKIDGFGYPLRFYSISLKIFKKSQILTIVFFTETLSSSLKWPKNKHATVASLVNRERERICRAVL